MLEELFEEQAAAPIHNSQLEGISNLAREQIDLQGKVEFAESELKDLKKLHKQVSQVDLPEALMSVGMTSFKMDSGEEISIKDQLRMSIAKKNKGECIQWLVDNGYSTIIKNTVTISFDMGDEDGVDNLLDLLHTNKYLHPVVDEAVNTATVKAIAKERMEDGLEFPMEIFGGFTYRESKIK
jgi:hypothetical protein